MNRTLVALAGAIALSVSTCSASPAFANTAPSPAPVTCPGISETELVEVATRAGYGIVDIFRGEQAAAVLAAYNAIPPATHLTADTLIVITNGGAVLIALVTAGCAAPEPIGPIPVTAWAGFVNSILGDPV